MKISMSYIFYVVEQYEWIIGRNTYHHYLSQLPYLISGNGNAQLHNDSPADRSQKHTYIILLQFWISLSYTHTHLSLSPSLLSLSLFELSPRVWVRACDHLIGVGTAGDMGSPNHPQSFLLLFYRLNFTLFRSLKVLWILFSFIVRKVEAELFQFILLSYWKLRI